MQRLNPATIHPPFANYAHGVSVPAATRLVFCSGQLGIDPLGQIPDGVEAQAALCFEAIRAVLGEAGLRLGDLIRINAYVTGREHLRGYMAVRDRYIDTPAPASTLMIVAGFARPEFVVEVEAVAGRAD